VVVGASGASGSQIAEGSRWSGRLDEAVYRDVEVQCLIVAAGSQACWDDPEGVLAEARASGTAAGEPVQTGWILWPPIPYSFNTVNDIQGTAPSAPDARHWLELLRTHIKRRTRLARHGP
jgi:hypothetical protein